MVPIEPPAGWILYDDSCGFCRNWVPWWAGTLQKRGFAVAPLQSDWVRAKLTLSEVELISDLRLLLPDGRQISGANVYRHVMQRIWWAWPFYLLSVAPILHVVFDWGYRTFAINRFLVSRACRLPGRSAESP